MYEYASEIRQRKKHLDVLNKCYKRYFPGFAYTKKQPRDDMFNKEMNDLKEIYEGGLLTIDTDIARMLPNLLEYMEQFISLNKEKEEMENRVDELNRKIEFCENGDE